MVLKGGQNLGNINTTEKGSEWKQNLQPHTREWVERQPVWRDRDIAVSIAIALFMGFVIGYISKWM